jgi:hypothetical protein
MHYDFIIVENSQLIINEIFYFFKIIDLQLILYPTLEWHKFAIFRHIVQDG